jgi:simple sugar transport system substrate-binding protein
VDYDFFLPMREGVRDAAEVLAVDATFDGVADGNVDLLARKALEALNEFDGLAINMTAPGVFSSVAREAAILSKPLIAINVDDPASARLASIGQNMVGAGRLLGREIRPYLEQNSSVLFTMHDPGITALEERAGGAQEELQTINILHRALITGTDRDVAVERIRQAIIEDPTIRAIIGTGMADTEAIGLALEAHFPGSEFMAAGFDTSPEIFRLVRSGFLQFTVDQQPYVQGYFAVVALALAVRKGVAPPDIDTGATLIRYTNRPDPRICNKVSE